MASPFRYFRKHQKLFIAIAAVVAMFVFVVADPLVSMLQKATGGAQRSPTATVASWDGGSITGRELEMLTQRRYFVSNFLETLQMTGARRIADEGGTPLPPNVPNFVLRPEESAPNTVMVGTITTRIFAQLAHDAGMSVSDEMINHYLREFGLRKVTDQDIADILQRMGRGNLRTSEDQLFSGLRELLLGNYYLRSYSSITQNVLPEQRWEDWRKINDRIAVEAAVFPAEHFVAQTPEPTDVDLRSFYDRYKDQIAGVRPGFREPRRVKLQYLLGDVNVWTDKLLDSVTDEEIADYYDRNKRTQFIKPEDTSTETTADSEPETEAQEPAEDKTSEESSEAPTKEPSADSAETESTEDNQPEESSGKSEPETEEPSEAPDESTEEPTSKEPADDESGSLNPTSPFRLVALQQEEAEPTSEAEDAEEAPDTEQQSTEPENSTADAEEKPAEETSEEPGGEPEAKEKPATDEPAEDKSVEYEPLENVADQIRRTLANDKAVVELKRVMERAYAELQTEYNHYGGEVITAQSEDREPPPPPAKLADLGITAKELGLVHEETTLLSQRELADTFVGKAVDAQSGRQVVLRAAFGEEMHLYEPYLAQDLDGHWYLVLKVEDVASRVPPLDEIRDQVAAAWKQQEAAKLALQTAEKLAAEAEESGETLAGFFADKGYEVVTTDLFSWLTFGTTPMEMRRGPQLGEAPPLSSIGGAFMQEAFALKPNQVVALLNYDESDAYAIRLERREKTEEELRKLFLSEANNWFGGQIMMTGRWQNAQRHLISQLTDRVNLDLTPLQEYLQPNDDG